MAARNIFRVIFYGNNWVVTKNKAVLSLHSSKEKAVKKAWNLANKTISSQVSIYRENGSIQKNNTDFKNI